MDERLSDLDKPSGMEPRAGQTYAQVNVTSAFDGENGAAGSVERIVAQRRLYRKGTRPPGRPCREQPAR